MKTMMAAVFAILAAVVSFGSVAGAEEGTVKAAATWKARSFVFPVGQDQAYLVGVYSGTLYVEDGQGALHAASIVCPATAEGDLKSMTKTGQGRCILTDEDGNRIYARFTCTGDLEGCRGPFKIEGGTGRFQGITGEGEMISRILVRQITAVVGFETAEQEGEGVAVWPSLTYRIPEKN
ncbi:MAG TPA: hypothetical protein VLA99_17815 [Nitrospiraceae bacterium]|nr:hypothetical protein [Nitrospiraceae bacterium]